MDMGRRLVVALAILGVFGPALAVFAPARPAAARSIEAPSGRTLASSAAARTAPNEPRLLVHFQPAATAADRDAAIASIGGTVDRVLDRIDVTRVAIHVPADPESDEVRLTELRLAGHAAVLSVELDSIGSVQFSPNDPLYLSDPSFHLGQWGSRKIHVDQAWDVARGSPTITVAVIDTGIDAGHPDLAGVILPGTTFVSLPDSTCAVGSTIDDNGHGTHVAGVIAANGNNGIGVAGVAFGVKILPIKALDCQGRGLMSDVASGVIWAADHGARVINISLGSNAGQATLQDAIRYAVAHNVLVVAAAGNCGVLSGACTTVNEPQYPGAYPEVLAVAATDENDAHASFSNTGAYVGISAPGVRIFSTTPTYPTTLSRAGSPTSYAAFSGTSQATPMVAGVAALLLSRDSTLTPAQLAARLRATADDLGISGADPVFGAGRLNALRAISASASTIFGAGYDASAVPTRASFTAPISAAVKLTNTSSFAWPAGGTTPVHLSYHWTDGSGATVVWDGQRTALPADVPVGTTVTVQAAIATPQTAGTYLLRLDLVQEGVAWFSGKGVATANVTVAVTSGLGATYAPTAGTASVVALGTNAFNITVSNTGTVSWPAGGATPVHLSYHWLDQLGNVVLWDGVRGALAADLPPGRSAVVALPVAAPSQTGSYILRLDLVQEGVTWFSSQGVTPRDLAVSVTTGFSASYTVGAPPQLLPGGRASVPVTVRNDGLVTWPATGTNAVHIASHIADAAGATVLWDGARAVLPADLAPGQSVTVSVAIAAPLGGGTYTVRVDAVREGIAWLSAYGIATGNVALIVNPDYRAQVALGSTSISRSAPSVSVTVTNPTATTWTPGGTVPLSVSSHWLAADGTVLLWDGPRVSIAQTVAPGASFTITLPLATPPAGASSLVVDLVAEGLRWFGNGSPRAITLVP